MGRPPPQPPQRPPRRACRHGFWLPMVSNAKIVIGHQDEASKCLKEPTWRKAYGRSTRRPAEGHVMQGTSGAFRHACRLLVTKSQCVSPASTAHVLSHNSLVAGSGPVQVQAAAGVHVAATRQDAAHVCALRQRTSAHLDPPFARDRNLSMLDDNKKWRHAGSRPAGCRPCPCPVTTYCQHA